MPEVRGDLRQGFDDERPLVHPRMRQDRCRILAHQVTEEQQVQVEGPRTPSQLSCFLPACAWAQRRGPAELMRVILQ